MPLHGTPITAVPEFFTEWVSWFSGDSTDLDTEWTPFHMHMR